MAFDVQGALKAGYSENEIADYLGQQLKFDAAGAIQSGYSPRDVINYLANPQPAPFSAADIGLTGVSAATGAVKSVLQAFGPTTPGIESLGSFQQTLESLKTPERQAEIRRRRAMEEQASKTGQTGEEISAFLGGIKEEIGRAHV